MATLAKMKLSGSTDGRGIKVTTASPIDGSDTTIHTAQASATLYDWVTLYAYNSDTVTRDLHLGWGGTSLPDDGCIVPIPPQEGFVLVVADFAIRNALVIVASASATNVITIHGSVVRES